VDTTIERYFEWRVNLNGRSKRRTARRFVGMSLSCFRHHEFRGMPDQVAHFLRYRPTMAAAGASVAPMKVRLPAAPVPYRA
jgi:hypothetical protein